VTVNYWSGDVTLETDYGLLTDTRSKESAEFQIELLEDNSGGCLARMSGHLIGATAAALWSVEPLMANEARVVLDLSGVVAIDSAGLEATIRLMDAIREFGGRLTIGRDQSSGDGVTKSILPDTTSRRQ